MSSLATNAITDASGGNTTTINGYTPTVSNMAGRNRLINSDMRIDQRNAGASVDTSITNSTTYTLDRFYYVATQASKFTIQQNGGSIAPPAGFNSYAGLTSTSSYTPTASDLFIFEQKIEGHNIADFNWGSANAADVTLSFWVRSSLTGTFSGSLRNINDTRNYAYTYTIDSANTWEKKTITITGDTTGTWDSTTGAGVKVGFCIGAGSNYLTTAGSWGGTTVVGATGTTSVVGTSGATFYLTGVQLEAGSVATPFEHRQYGQELALCQRYYQKYAGQPSAYLGNGNLARNGWLTSFIYPVKMRTAPTASNITGFAAGNATTYAFSSPSMVTTVDGLYEIYGASATAIGYSEPFCIFFTTLDLSAEL
jgi:hypothetical protein